MEVSLCGSEFPMIRDRRESLCAYRVVYIDDTNQEGRTRSGINMSVRPDPSAGPEGAHEGLA